MLAGSCTRYWQKATPMWLTACLLPELRHRGAGGVDAMVTATDAALRGPRIEDEELLAEDTLCPPGSSTSRSPN